MNMKQYLPIFVAALLCVSAASCDRSDPDGSVTIPEKPVFDTSTNAGKQAQHIYDTYGLHCHWDFESDDYIYELTTTSSADYTEVDDMECMAEFLTSFEEKALKVLPIEIIQKSFSHLFICNEILDTYTKSIFGASDYMSTSDEEITDLLPMKVKTLGVVLGYAGSKWREADMDELQLSWIEAIFETMLNNAPTPTDFNKAALMDVADIAGDAYATNYAASKQWGWWCIQGGDAETGKAGGYQYDWGLLAPPYVGLFGVAYRDDAEVQIKVTMGYSRWYDSGYTAAMDFATYAAFILLKPATYMDDLCAKYPLVKQKVQLVKEYFLENFNYELKSIAQ